MGMGMRNGEWGIGNGEFGRDKLRIWIRKIGMPNGEWRMGSGAIGNANGEGDTGAEVMEMRIWILF